MNKGPRMAPGSRIARRVIYFNHSPYLSCGSFIEEYSMATKSTTTTTTAVATTRAKGISLHIGLNAVNAADYGGWDGPLAAC